MSYCIYELNCCSSSHLIQCYVYDEKHKVCKCTRNLVEFSFRLCQIFEVEIAAIGVIIMKKVDLVSFISTLDNLFFGDSGLWNWRRKNFMSAHYRFPDFKFVPCTNVQYLKLIKVVVNIGGTEILQEVKISRLPATSDFIYSFVILGY